MIEFLGKTPMLKMAAGEDRQDRWEPPGEQQSLQQFSGLQALMPGISRMPPNLREAIEWAEGEKTKRGIN